MEYDIVRITWNKHYYDFNIIQIIKIITKKYYVCKHPNENIYAAFTYNEEIKLYENINDINGNYLITLRKKM